MFLDELISLFIPIFPYFNQVLNHIDFVPSQLLQKVLVKLGFLSSEPFPLDKGHKSNDDVGQALYSLFFFLVILVFNFKLVLLL